MPQNFASHVALTSGSTWTSSVVRTDRNDNIVGLVWADQAGVLHVEQSTDGVNWDLDTTTNVTATTGTSFSVPIYGAFLRLRYVNGGTNQGAFRISSRFSSAGDS